MKTEIMMIILLFTAEFDCPYYLNDSLMQIIAIFSVFSVLNSTLVCGAFTFKISF